MTLVVRLVLFASSFAIVLALAGIRLWGRDEQMAIWAFAAAAATLVPAALIVWYASGAGTFSGTVGEFERKGESIGGYLAGYALPIILVEPSVSSDVTAVVVFVVVLSLTYAAADLHYLNPLLPLFGFRVWDVVVDAAGTEHRFIAIGWRLDIRSKSQLCVVGDGPVRLVRAIAAGQRCG